MCALGGDSITIQVSEQLWLCDVFRRCAAIAEVTIAVDVVDVWGGGVYIRKSLSLFPGSAICCFESVRNPFGCSLLSTVKKHNSSSLRLRKRQVGAAHFDVGGPDRSCFSTLKGQPPLGLLSTERLRRLL